MDAEEKSDTDKPESTPPTLTQESQEVDTSPASPATAQQLTEVEQQMSRFEKSTLRWARTAVIMSGLAAVFVCAQWLEMHSAGGQTDSLLSLYRKQLEQLSRQAGDTHDLAVAAKAQSDQTKTIADQAVIQAGAAKVPPRLLPIKLVLSERPWLKIKHRIISPLTFDVGGRMGGPIAMMTLEDTIENVGQSVAVNVLHWEQIIPLDPDFPNELKTARARQNQYCDANRHPKGLPGYTMFPHDPIVFQGEIGVPMSKIHAAEIHYMPGRKINIIGPNDSRLDGAVGFVVVGCVFYKFPFESASKPTHQTRFLYHLGVPKDGGYLPYVQPTGVASDLQLIAMPEGFTAD